MKTKHSPFLIALLTMTLVFNLTDLWYTLFAIDLIPAAYEANPVFRLMLNHPYLCVLYKHTVIPAFLYILYKFRAHPSARLAIYALFIIFLINQLCQIYAVIFKW